MNRKTAVLKNFGLAMVGLVSGFLGGVAHDQAQARKDVVRAQRFEVVSGAGKILSYWGPDSNPLMPVTAPKESSLFSSTREACVAAKSDLSRVILVLN
jgi:hypothetical protein